MVVAIPFWAIGMWSVLWLQPGVTICTHRVIGCLKTDTVNGVNSVEISGLSCSVLCSPWLLDQIWWQGRLSLSCSDSVGYENMQASRETQLRENAKL